MNGKKILFLHKKGYADFEKPFFQKFFQLQCCSEEVLSEEHVRMQLVDTKLNIQEILIIC